MRSITKLSMPKLNSQLVQRPAPLVQLDEVTQTGLAVVCAPAGYGKTTLVSQWLTSSRKNFAWLTLDERDNDAGYFWQGVRAALETVSDRFSDSAELAEVYQSANAVQVQIDALLELLTEYARTWSVPEQLVLVLDDFHEIKNPQIHKQLSFFIDDCPVFVKVVVVSRFEPHLNLSDRRVKQTLTELDSRDLCFDMAACKALLTSRFTDTIDDEDVQVLYSKTEGWAAAIHLACLALKHKESKSSFIESFTGNQKLLSSYLLDQVFTQLSEEMKLTLIKIAVLPKFRAELVEATAGHPNGHQFISTLRELNILISAIDEEECWFRFHDLFRDWLLKQAAESSSVDLVAVRRKAGAWLESQAMYLDALEHIFGCEDWQWASRVSGAFQTDLFRTGEFGVMRTILDCFPSDFIDTQPKLCLMAASIEFVNDVSTNIEDKLVTANKRLAALIEDDSEVARRELGLQADENAYELMATLYSFHSLILGFQGRHEQSRLMATKVLSIPGVESFPLYANALLKDGLDLFCQNQFQQAELVLIEAISVSKRNRDIACLIRSSHTLMGIYYHLGKHYLAPSIVEDLEDFLDPAIKKHKIMGQLFNLCKALAYIFNNQYKDALQLLEVDSRYRSYLPLIDQMTAKFTEVLALLGSYRLDEAMRKQDEMILLYKANFVSWNFPQPDIEAFRAIIYLWKGDQESLFRWAHSYELHTSNSCLHARAESEGIFLLAQVLQGKDIRAQAKNYRQMAEQCHAIVWQIRSWFLDVAYYGLKGKKIRAMNAFAKALKLGAANDVVSVFLENGEMNIPLLEGAIKLRIETKFASKVLALIKGDQHIGTHTKGACLSPVALNPLSERELELLKYINEGYSNKQIAAATQITEGTVKAHLSNVYSKLAVKNRTQALAVAREHGLLQEAAS